MPTHTTLLSTRNLVPAGRFMKIPTASPALAQRATAASSAVPPAPDLLEPLPGPALARRALIRNLCPVRALVQAGWARDRDQPCDLAGKIGTLTARFRAIPHGFRAN